MDAQPTVKILRLDEIRIDGGTQCREEIDTDTVADYAKSYMAEQVLPFPDVFHDGSHYWLAAGFHRYHGRRHAGFEEIECNVHIGTLSDAVWFSVGSNRKNGKRMTNADKRRAIELALKDSGLSQLSDRAIAEQVGVSHMTVNRIRAELSQSDSCNNGKDGQDATQSRTTGKDGKTRRRPKAKESNSTEHALDREPPQKPASNGNGKGSRVRDSTDRTLHKAIEQLQDAIEKTKDRWPQEHLEVMGHHLKAAGEEILQEVLNGHV